MADYRQLIPKGKIDWIPLRCSECKQPIEPERQPHSICAKCVDKAVSLILERERIHKARNGAILQGFKQNLKAIEYLLK